MFLLNRVPQVRYANLAGAQFCEYADLWRPPAFCKAAPAKPQSSNRARSRATSLTKTPGGLNGLRGATRRLSHQRHARGPTPVGYGIPKTHVPFQIRPSSFPSSGAPEHRNHPSGWPMRMRRCCPNSVGAAGVEPAVRSSTRSCRGLKTAAGAAGHACRRCRGTEVMATTGPPSTFAQRHPCALLRSSLKQSRGSSTAAYLLSRSAGGESRRAGGLIRHVRSLRTRERVLDARDETGRGDLIIRPHLYEKITRSASPHAPPAAVPTLPSNGRARFIHIMAKPMHI